MAAVSIPPSPQALSTMGSRRVPLANVPNAANSPYRGVAATAGTKRPRPYASDQRELAYGQQPPAKKQIIEVDNQEARRNALLRKAGYSQPTSLQKKLEAVRDARTTVKAVEKPQKTPTESLESIRQWQKHYRRVFPQFVFYFENIPDDVRIKLTRQLQSLGSREEKFFSKAVTHVITTRPIPPEVDTSSSAGGRTPSTKHAGTHEADSQARTINPSLLERSMALQNQVNQSKGKFLFDAALQKASHPTTQSSLQETDLRRPPGNSNDILYKAREMSMKIWALEKIQRMMTTMFETDTGEQPPAPSKPRGTGALITKAGRDADLSQLLQNEKVNGPADRDWSVATKDLAHFRGYYIYVHDMDEKTRPVMIRDYPKPHTKEEGKWPQFRLTAPGRCPFVEDAGHIRKLNLEEQQQKAARQRPNGVQNAAPRTRAAAALDAKQRVPANDTDRQALVENNNVANRLSTATSQAVDQGFSKPLDPPKIMPTKRGNPDSMPPMFGSAQASLRSMPRIVGGEPVASGVQPSNVTSAIRSQMISSTAAAPGARAGTSREVHQLKRKVLEKNNAPSANSMGSSYLNDVRAAINGDRTAPPRAAKRKAQESLAQIHEDEEEVDNARKLAAARRKKPVERELKPGYCENCRDKFEDFNEHIISRKHRKFALTPDNWRELDELLSQLVRQPKNQEDNLSL